eukprot:scaffold259_cov252-Pinguiococcus_pyrenoidosus.AAC.35
MIGAFPTLGFHPTCCRNDPEDPDDISMKDWRRLQNVGARPARIAEQTKGHSNSRGRARNRGAAREGAQALDCPFPTLRRSSGTKWRTPVDLAPSLHPRAASR